MNDKAKSHAATPKLHYVCRCGAEFTSRKHFTEHVGAHPELCDKAANATPSELESKLRDGVPSTVETASGYFKRLYPEYYVQIITNINAERGPEMTAHLLSSPAMPNELYCAFIWSASPEGDAFWRAVARREEAQ